MYGVAFLTRPIQQSFYHAFHSEGYVDPKIQRLSLENESLRKRLVDQEKLLVENSALRDQFKTVSPKSSHLLPAQIIGAPEFVPGVSQPETLVLDKGSRDGVKKGEAVISKANLVGIITHVSPGLSTVSLIIKGDMSFIAKTVETQAGGVVNAKGESGLELGNVVLAQHLERGDMVVTKGDVHTDGTGLLPDLIVGEIIDIDKKASSLFQAAKIKSLVDFSTLSTVFIIESSL